VLEQIVQTVRSRIENTNRDEWKSEIETKLAKAGPVPSFRDAIAGQEPSYIFEIKRNSPSTPGNPLGFDVAAMASLYESCGASCISVLTEPDFFSGSLDDLDTVREAATIPILRKDFTVDELQILEARAHGASAVLLIVAVLSDTELKSFISRADDAGLDSLVEVHSERELNRALDIGARIIGVNNRNLKTLEIDLSTGEHLLSRIPNYIISVAESGMKGRNDVERMRNADADALLIGTSVVRSANPEKAIRELILS